MNLVHCAGALDTGDVRNGPPAQTSPSVRPQVVVAGFSLGGADPGAGPGIGFCALRAGSTAGSIRPWASRCSRTTPRAFVLTMSQPISGWSMSEPVRPVRALRSLFVVLVDLLQEFIRADAELNSRNGNRLR